ncbi:unnamed protein product [Cuscuta epithymum]|uniref:Uncharacterized protein n=1 Tax=Cuscuta epithymum TaxID=186058 RepID=A0AAV0EFI7_9ASTE|nr:unnamed protein product [Cuscuta epithymum]
MRSSTHRFNAGEKLIARSDFNHFLCPGISSPSHLIVRLRRLLKRPDEVQGEIGSYFVVTSPIVDDDDDDDRDLPKLNDDDRDLPKLNDEIADYIRS